MGEIHISKTFSVLLLLFLFSQQALAQFEEHFDDDNVTNAPVWTGDVAKYAITGAAKQLQIIDGSASPAQLVTAFSIPTNHNVQWEFFLRQNFAPSNSNNTRIYLMSDQSVLTASLNGYFLQFGEDLGNDAIRLFRQTGTTTTLICSGATGAIALNPVIVRVRVTRSVEGNWTLYADYTGATSFVEIATGSDNTHTTSNFFGIRSVFTATNDTNLFYDDLIITTTQAPDVIAPTISDVDAVNNLQIDVTFSEQVTENTAESLTNYLVADHTITSISLSASGLVASLTLEDELTNGQSFSITVGGIADIAGNILSNFQQSVLFFQPVASDRHDIVITEFFPDPVPSVALPEAEFVEVFNRSTDPFDLYGWKITDGATTTIVNSHYILLPNQYVVLTHHSAAANYELLGPTISLPSFPGLNNSGDTIKILNPLNQTIDSLYYNATWYHGEEEKQSGGWTIERMNPHDFCRGSENWTASLAPSGGTPGQQNSVFEIIEDNVGPRLVDVNQSGAAKLTVLFDERLGANSFISDVFGLSPTVTIDSVGLHDGGKAVDLLLADVLDTAEVYTITANVVDCPGNEIQQEYNSKTFKLDSIAPQIQEVQTTSDTTVVIHFSEKIVLSQGSQIGIVGHLIKRRETLAASVLRLVMEEPFPNGPELTLAFSSIYDVAQNETDSTVVFRYFVAVAPSVHDLIVTEFFPDPTPSIGLPEFEFVEILNRSHHPFDLSGWSITDGSTVSTISGRHIVLPGEYVLLCQSAAVSHFPHGSRVIGLANFPSLNNSSDQIKLVSPSLRTIDSLSYSQQWYHGDEDKQGGGWTIERKNINDFCRTIDNWDASSDPTGGTPGYQNSRFENSEDMLGPRLLNVEPIASDVVLLHFNELLNAAKPALDQVTFNNSATADSIAFYNDQHSLLIRLAESLDTAQTYTISIDNVRDCPGNLIQPEFSSMIFRMDTIAPTLLAAEVLSDSTIRLTFSERITESLSNTNFTLSHGNPALVHQSTYKIVDLTFSNKLQNGVLNSLIVSGIVDRAGNVMDSTIVKVRYFVPIAPHFKDIIVTEIFPDPAPTQGLPEAEFVELYNRSSNPFDLSGWKITDGSTVGVLPPFILLPGEYLIVCATTHKSQFSSFGDVVGISSFPSLNNSSDIVTLLDTGSQIIDSLRYHLSWYHDSSKDDGGFSLELIHVNDFCKRDLNWKSSESPLGGTPGIQNSVYSNQTDVTGPKLISAVLTSPHAIKLLFDEPLHSDAATETKIQISPSLQFNSITVAPNESELILSLISPADSTDTYSINIAGVRDCPGNLVNEDFSTFVLKLDTLKPAITQFNIISPSEVEIVYSEKVDAISATSASNYVFEQDETATLQLIAPARIRLTLASPLQNGLTKSLTIRNVEDRAGNKIAATTLELLFFQPVEVTAKDVVMTEIFSDPSPTVGLPEVEFVEIYNRSNNAINLEGWTISDGGKPSVFSKVLMLPNEFIVACPLSQKNQFPQNIKVMGLTNFPSLNNSGDYVILKSSEGLTIDSVQYNASWYRDEDKEDGGWTLEKIDPNNTCAEETNWLASESPTGGTPGAANSVAAEMPDLTGPVLVSVFPVDSLTLIATFNEKLSDQAHQQSVATLNPPRPIQRLEFTNESLRVLTIMLQQPLERGILYTFSVETFDCAGNAIQDEGSQLKIARPDRSAPTDIIINEILFNPTSTGVDFIEIVNRSDKFLDLKDWQIANVVKDTLRTKIKISDSHQLIYPGEYLVLTQDIAQLMSEYPSGIESTFHEMELPSLPDDAGAVVVLDEAENVIDRFDYDDEFHSSLLNNTEGVSLERISMSQITQNPENWKSASSAVGFATPGYLNSNSLEFATGNEQISIQPEIFSPSGQPDFAAINYQFEKGGYIANVKVVDAQGREIKRVASNELLGIDGFFRWDGDDNHGRKANIGTYMIWFQIFDDTGTVKTMRKRVVLAERF